MWDSFESHNAFLQNVLLAKTEEEAVCPLQNALTELTIWKC